MVIPSNSRTLAAGISLGIARAGLTDAFDYLQQREALGRYAEAVIDQEHGGAGQLKTPAACGEAV